MVNRRRKIIVKALDVRSELDVDEGELQIDDVAVTVSAAEINVLEAALAGASFTIGAEGANAITVNIQLEDAEAVALATRATCFGYLSDDAAGDSIVATAPSTTVAAGTDGVYMPIEAKKSFMITSESDGDMDLVITETGVDTFYLILVMPNGSLVASGAITFA